MSSCPDSSRSSSALWSGMISTTTRSRYGSGVPSGGLARSSADCARTRGAAPARTRSARTGRGRRSRTAACRGPTPSLKRAGLRARASSLWRGRIGRLSSMPQRPARTAPESVIATVCGSAAVTAGFFPPTCSESASADARARHTPPQTKTRTSSAVNGWPSEKADARRQRDRHAPAVASTAVQLSRQPRLHVPASAWLTRTSQRASSERTARSVGLRACQAIESCAARCGPRRCSSPPRTRRRGRRNPAESAAPRADRHRRRDRRCSDGQACSA